MKVATYNLSKIVRNAWYLKKSQPSMTFSACLRKAWRNEKQIARFSHNLDKPMNEATQIVDRLTQMLDEQAACIERIIALLDK